MHILFCCTLFWCRYNINYPGFRCFTHVFQGLFEATSNETLPDLDIIEHQ